MAIVYVPEANFFVIILLSNHVNIIYQNAFGILFLFPLIVLSTSFRKASLFVCWGRQMGAGEGAAKQSLCDLEGQKKIQLMFRGGAEICVFPFRYWKLIVYDPRPPNNPKSAGDIHHPDKPPVMRTAFCYECIFRSLSMVKCKKILDGNTHI